MSTVVTGCQHEIVRLVDADRFEEAIEVAEGRRRRPRGRAARAYARALVQTGRPDRGRDVLLRDFRAGGKLDTLVALADLERDLGLQGSAAIHYARAFDLRPDSISSRQDVCALFRTRAHALLAAGEGLSAAEELARATQTCAPIDDAMAHQDQQLATAIDTVADRQVANRIARTTCGERCAAIPVRQRASALDADLAAARTRSSRALVDVALAHGSRLDPGDVASVVMAELRGELGPHVSTDDELRVLVGDRGWSEFAPAVMTRPPAEAAWLQLRLGSVIEDLPVPPAPRRGASQTERWAELASELSEADRFRVFALEGDLPAVELELSSRHRPRSVPTEPTEDQDGELVLPAAPHWSMGVAVDARSLPALLMIANLRRAAGQPDLSLQLRRDALRRAQPVVPTLGAIVARDEGIRDIAYGRPWHALAVLDAVPEAWRADVWAAAATAVALTRVFCDGPCRDDEDEATVRRVLGDDWVDAALLDLSRWMRPAVAPGETGACPTVRQLVAADADGPIADALRRWRADPTAPGRGEDLARAVEASPSLICSRATVLAVLAEGGHVTAAERLAELYAHAPQLSAAGELDAHARLAMIAGQPSRAELLMTAALAAASEPVEAALGLARFGRRVGIRHLELMALKEAILHAPGLELPAARRAMVEHALWDLQRGWAESSGGAGADAARTHVDDYLASMPSNVRHQARIRLARLVAAAPWLQDSTRPAVAAAVFGEQLADGQLQREVALVRGERLAAPKGPFDVTGLADDVAPGGVTEVPVSLQIFADPQAVLPLVAALTRAGRDWIPWGRAGVGVGLWGAAPDRFRGVATIVTLVGDDTKRRHALFELLARGPGALEPARSPDGVRWSATRVIADEEILFALAFGLDPEPSLVAR